VSGKAATLDAEIVRTARRYLGVPFLHQGRTRAGADCVGLLVLVARDMRLRHRDLLTYGRNPNPRQLLEALSTSCERIDDPTRPLSPHEVWACSRPGDIVVFWFSGPGAPQHVAIRTERGMLHTWANVRRVVEHGLTDHWRERVHSVWRYQPD
jgi:cell wall-associated NlpC family hydrolase